MAKKAKETVDTLLEKAVLAEKRAGDMKGLGDFHAMKAFKQEALGWLEDALELETKLA